MRVRVGTALTGVSLLVISILTLLPAESDTASWNCLFCGTFTTADAILNVLLFVPLGIGVALCAWPFNKALILASALSVTIEASQLFIPGRDASLADVLTNVIGCTVGLGVAATARIWLSPTDNVAKWLSAGSASLLVVVVAATGFLLQPSFPESTYYGQWTPDLGSLEWYRGQVLAAAIGEHPLPSRKLSDSPAVRSLWLQGTPVEIIAVAGPAPSGLGSLFSIYDRRRREILLIGPDRHDLVLRYRARTWDWRLHQPDLRFPGVLSETSPGDRISVSARRDGSYYCLSVDQEGRCGLGQTVAVGWAFFLQSDNMPGAARTALGWAWLFLLILPLGFWAKRSAVSALACGFAVLSLAGLPGSVGLLPTRRFEWLACMLGLAGGVLLQRLAAALKDRRRR